MRGEGEATAHGGCSGGPRAGNGGQHQEGKCSGGVEGAGGARSGGCGEVRSSMGRTGELGGTWHLGWARMDEQRHQAGTLHSWRGGTACSEAWPWESFRPCLGKGSHVDD